MRFNRITGVYQGVYHVIKRKCSEILISERQLDGPGRSTLAHLLDYPKDVMQGKLFQKCTYLLYCSVLSLGGTVNTRRMSKPDMESIFHIKNQYNILVIGSFYVNYQNYQN